MSLEATADGLPRRTAHALHALLCAVDEHHMPVTAAEVLLYDGEALSARQTGSALAHGQRLGLCARSPGGYWAPGNGAYELRRQLEDRYLRDEDARE